MAKKHKAGGNYVQTNKEAKRSALAGPIYHNHGTGYARGGHVSSGLKGGSGSGLGRLRNSRVAAKVPAKTES